MSKQDEILSDNAAAARRKARNIWYSEYLVDRDDTTYDEDVAAFQAAIIAAEYADRDRDEYP